MARQALVSQGRRMGSNFKPWGALGGVRQRCGTVQFHERHSGMCGMDWDLGRHKGAGRDRNQEAPVAPRWETWSPNRVAVQVETRGSERNLGVKEGDRAW